MKALRMLGAVTAAFFAGCGAGTSGVSDAETPHDAGAPQDAGFQYTGPSVGTAILSGAITGTAPVDSSASFSPAAFLEPDGGNSDGYVEWVLGTASPTANPQFSCSFVIYSATTLPLGSLGPADVSELICVVVFHPDGGTEEDWSGGVGTPFAPPSTFSLSVSSLGPVTTIPTSGSDISIWLDPTATLDVYLAPSAGQTLGVGFSVAVAPPPCPANCAPGP